MNNEDPNDNEIDEPEINENEIAEITVSYTVRICKKCERNIDAPLFDGCMNKNCPHGFEPCF